MAINDNGFSALFWASFKDYTEVVKLLLDKSADVNTKAKDGYSALNRAKENGHTDIVELLEKAEAKK
jgi:ankyrin repeat protein